jgi:hypothetical protein
VVLKVCEDGTEKLRAVQGVLKMDGIPEIDRKAIQDGETFWEHIRRKGGDCDAVFIALRLHTAICRMYSARGASEAAGNADTVVGLSDALYGLLGAEKAERCYGWTARQMGSETFRELPVALADANRKIKERAVRYD